MDVSKQGRSDEVLGLSATTADVQLSREAQAIGASWTPHLRACDDCGDKHCTLVNRMNGESRCYVCHFKKMKGPQHAR